MISLRRIAHFLILVSPVLVLAQTSSSTQAPADPTLKARPAVPPPRNAAISEGSLHLDLSVTDPSGNPVTDLQPWDLKLTDNGQPSKILSFRGYDGKTVLPDPPVEVILVLDELNLSLQQVAFMRDQVTRFLRQNNGRPALPISIMFLTDTGLRVQPQPSLDGNGMATLVQSLHPNVSSINSGTGFQGSMERVQVSLREIERIADNESRRPGRKLLLWMSPGWPLLDSVHVSFSDQQRGAFFDATVSLQNDLRKSRITVYGIVPEFSSMGLNEGILSRYQSFLKPVEFARQASPSNLALGVLAEHTGGGILGPSNDLVSLMNTCLVHASAYYRISFNAPTAERFDEYHALQIQVDRLNLTVRTDTGYYNEPDQKP